MVARGGPGKKRTEFLNLAFIVILTGDQFSISGEIITVATTDCCRQIRWPLRSGRLRETAALTYDAESRTVTVKGGPPFPLLVERALHTASGRCAKFLRGGIRVYPNIEKNRALQVADCRHAASDESKDTMRCVMSSKTL